MATINPAVDPITGQLLPAYQNAIAAQGNGAVTNAPVQTPVQTPVSDQTPPPLPPELANVDLSNLPPPPMDNTSTPAAPAQSSSPSWWDSIVNSGGNNVPAQTAPGDNPEGKIGAGVHNAIAPVVGNSYIHGLMSAIGNAFQSSPLGNDFNQLAGIASAATGTPDLFGPNPLNPQGTATGANGTGIPQTAASTPADPLIAQTQQKIGQYNSMLQGMNPMNPRYKMYTEALNTLNTQLKEYQAQQVSYLAENGKMGALSADDAKEASTLGSAAKSSHQLLSKMGDVVGKVTENPNDMSVLPELQSLAESYITNHNMELGLKRAPGGGAEAAGAITAAAGGDLSGFLDPQSGLIDPNRVKGVLKAMAIESKIEDTKFDTLMRYGRIYDSSGEASGKPMFPGNLKTAQLMNPDYDPNNANSQVNKLYKAYDSNISGETDNNKWKTMSDLGLNLAKTEGGLAGKYAIASKAAQVGGGLNEGLSIIKNLFGYGPNDQLSDSQKQALDGIPAPAQQAGIKLQQRLQADPTNPDLLSKKALFLKTYPNVQKSFMK